MQTREQISLIAVMTAGLTLSAGCTLVRSAAPDDSFTSTQPQHQSYLSAPTNTGAPPLTLAAKDAFLAPVATDIISLSLVSSIGRPASETPLLLPQSGLEWQDVASQRLVYDSRGLSTFNLDGQRPVDTYAWRQSSTLDELNGRLEARRVLQPYYDIDAESLNFNAAVDFAARSDQTGLNFDLGFTPRAGVRTEGDYRVRSIGAEFRLGRGFLKGFDQRGQRIENGGWYIFAGADGEAVIWNTGRDGISFGLPSTDALSLQDKVTVGDIQAGITFERFGGEWSASYIRREVEYNDQSIQIERNEDFGGISFTLRR